MTRLIVSTNRREAPLSEPSGWIFIVDLEKPEVLQKTSGLEPPYRAFDHNPRGGMRGMRGLSFFNGELAAADYSSIFFFDRKWNLTRAITHPSVSAIHEILQVENGIWVTSTINDTLVRFDRNGDLAEIHYVREQRDLMRLLNGPRKILFRSSDFHEGMFDFRKRSYFTSDLYDRLHLNGLTVSPDGRMVVSLGLVVGEMFGILMFVKTMMRRYKIWNLFLALNRVVRCLLGIEKKMLSELVIQPRQGRSAIVSMDRSGKWDVHIQFPVTHNPSHSVRLLEDGTGLYLNSSYGALVHFGMNGEILMEDKLTDEFLRGLLVLPDRRLIIGAGNALLTYDLKTRRTLSTYPLTQDPRDSVFDIQFFPSDFELPPASLAEKIGKVIGFEGRTILWEGQPGANSGPHS
jgi:hypothetical protein